jgi:hypothetical protein
MGISCPPGPGYQLTLGKNQKIATQKAFFCFQRNPQSSIACLTGI